MYISEELLKKEYDNPKIKLKEMLTEAIDKSAQAYVQNKEDVVVMLDTLAFLNAFCKSQGFKELNIDHNVIDKNDYGRKFIKNYLSEFLIDNNDLYAEYFSAKYEFKPEKLEEIKMLVLELKTDIKEENFLSEEEQEDIITIIDEVDKSLIAKTNDIDTVNGKLFRLKMTLNKFNVVSTKVNDKITTIFSKVNDINTFITNVQSIYNKADGLITNLTKLLGGS